MEIQDWGMKMVLHIFRRQDDALSCLTSRCIYSIDSSESILWILWLLVFSLYSLQSVINFWERLPYIIVIWYLWDSFRSLKDFFSTYSGYMKHEEDYSWRCAMCLQTHGLKARNEKVEKVHICHGRDNLRTGDKESISLKKIALFSLYWNIWTCIWIDTALNMQPLLKLRDEKCLVLIFGYITGWILQ